MHNKFAKKIQKRRKEKYEDKKAKCKKIILRKNKIVQNSKKRNIIVQCILIIPKFHITHNHCFFNKEMTYVAKMVITHRN
jgi:hypothetical protein